MAPSSTELRSLYVDERLTARQIGEQYGVAHITVLRWMKRHGIERRPPRNGLANRGQTGPTKAELTKLIYTDRLTYRQVASQFGVDSTAIPYWLDKFNIPRPSRTRIDPERVRTRYLAGESAAGIAEAEGCCKTTILNFLRAMDVQRRSEGWQRHVKAADGTVVRSTYESCVANWLYEHGVPYEYEPRVPFGHGNTRADFLVNGWYIEVWGVHSNRNYKEQKARKRAGYAAHQLPLIELSPHHFSQARHIFQRRMEQCLQAP